MQPGIQMHVQATWFQIVTSILPEQMVLTLHNGHYNTNPQRKIILVTQESTTSQGSAPSVEIRPNMPGSVPSVNTLSSCRPEQLLHGHGNV